MNLDPELLEPEEGRRGPVLKQVGARPGSRLSVATSLVAVLVGIAILKPWGVGTTTPPSRPPRTTIPIAVVPTPRPTNDDSADGLASPICLGAGAWQVATLETWRTQDVRVWRAVEPISEASGPLDSTIPSVPVVALEIGALGWCAPGHGPDRPVGPAEVTTWFVVGETATELQLRQVLPERGFTLIAALYERQAPCPPRRACPVTPEDAFTLPWATGRVVFRYEDLGAHRVSWFAADLDVIAPAAAAATGPPRNS